MPERSPVADARTALLDRVLTDVADHGLADRSLRELAASIGTSHRMLLYHFGSREGLVAAVVESTEAAQRDLLLALAAAHDDPSDLVRALWRQVSSPELRPFVRLFFETVAARGAGDDLTAPWLDTSGQAARAVGIDDDPAMLRLGVAVTRGLLIDVLTSGDVAPATESLDRFLDLWDRARPTS